MWKSIGVILLLTFLFNQAATIAADVPGTTLDPTAITGPANRPVRDKWALIVGIGTFQNRDIPKLRFAAKDAMDFRDFLINEANFAPDHVRILTDEKATQRRVLSELGNKYLARVAKPDDLVVLFFSSHGSPSQADVRGKNFVVAYDSDPEDLFTTGIEMDKILESIQSRVLSERVLLILDACHSGAVSENSKGLGRPGNFDAELLAQGSGQAVICSSEPTQQSWESKRYKNGIFTRKLLDALRLKGKQTTLNDAFPYIESSVSAEVQEDYGSRQSPSLKSKWAGKDLVLAAVPANPQILPVAVKQVLLPDSSLGNISMTPAPIPTLAAPLATPGRTHQARIEKTDDWHRAIFMYKRGDYASAIDVLQGAVKGPAAKDADAHYHLANALIKMGRTDAAVREYKESFRLNPNGKDADYCLQIISYYTTNKSSKRAGATAAPVYASPTTYGGNSDIKTSASTVTSTISAEAIGQVRAKLPRIIPIRYDRPYLSDVLNWSAQERAAFYTDAANRVEFARQRLDEANELLRKAKSMGSSLVPNARAYGQSEEVYKVQFVAGQSALNQLLVPFICEIDLRTKRLNEETSILQACDTAYKQLYSGGTYITPHCK